MVYSKLQPLAFGISFGILSGLSTLCFSLLSLFFYSGKPFSGEMGSIYISYNPSLTNSLLSAVLVFINTFILSFLAAWIYNFFIKLLVKTKLIQ